jgi:inhibitor of KinA sporulation pathway (predicted exonuclease)
LKNFILYDTEFTCWEGSLARNWKGNGEHREIIQVSALKINENLQIIDRINTTIKPIINPLLSEYCIHLTGLQQVDIDNSDNYSIFNEKFNKFTDYGNINCWSWGNDVNVLYENDNINHTELSNYKKNHFDLRTIFKMKNINIDNVSSGQLARHFGISLEGQAHNAEYDTLSLYHSIHKFQDIVTKYLY